LDIPRLVRLIHYRALPTLFREIKIKPDPDCPLCGDNPTITKPFTDKKEMTELPEITTLELRKILTDGLEGILLDVREQDEYMMAHIEGSELLPLSGWPSSACQPSQRTQSITSTAQPECEALEAGTWMLQNGFSDVTNVAGGMKQWLQEEQTS
jgi:adenylyltransferase/sulfurtransferase